MTQGYHLPTDTHIRDVTFRVQDLERSRAFYVDLLGFKVVGQQQSLLLLAPQADAEPVILLHEDKGAVAKPQRSTGLYHVAILLSGRPALGKIIFRLMSAHYPLGGASDHLVSEALYLSDPDGNGLEIYRDRPREEWKFDAAGVAMATDPMDMEGVLSDADKTSFTGIDPLARIGHVHLHVSDLKRAEEFYVKALGFDVMQRSYPGALFVAAGGYHHHMGLNIWAGNRQPPANAVGLESFTVAMSGGIDGALDNLTSHGYEAHMHDDHAHVLDQDGNALLLSAS